MNWNDFYKDINAGKVLPVYLFEGPEEYVKREALDALRAKLLPPGLETLNDVTLEGVSARQITDAAETMPMMCQHRIVTVRDWAPLLSAKSKNEEDEVQWMERWLDNPPDSCTLIFYMRQESDSRKKMTALLKKKAQPVAFDLLSDADLSKWCGQYLKKYGKRLSAKGFNTLTYMAGRELTRLCGELDKLSAYVGDERAQIDEEDVRAIVSASLEYNVFELLSSLIAGDVKAGQQTVNSLLQGGQTPIGILAMMTRQVRQLVHMKCGLDAGETTVQVQQRLKMHPYAARQTAKQCSRLSARWLIALYDECVEADYAVKSGQLRDREALDAMILRIGLATDRNR